MKRLIFSLLCAVLACAGALAQFRVTGTVFEPTGDTAIGASIIEKGNPKHAATTDIDGNFSINVSSGKATLVISYVGMETQEVPVNDRAKIEVTLQESKTVLNEVVIVGYGTQKKSTPPVLSRLSATMCSKADPSPTPCRVFKALSQA